MKRRLWPIAILGCVLALSGATALVEMATAQDHDSVAQENAEVKRKLKSKVVPEYPPIAKRFGLQGKVKIETTVAADGHVVTTKVVGGNPLLANAAVDAIKKWRFETGPKETVELIEIDFLAQH
jgi:TonB family protein